MPATLLLPDGTVLLLSGENPDINQIRYRTHDATSDPRYPQTFDPETMTLTTEIFAREDTFRGYHNFASLTHDGTVMLGSGFNQFGDVGCENPNLRLFYPSYLFKGPRPECHRRVSGPAAPTASSPQPFAGRHSAAVPAQNSLTTS